MTTTDLKDSAYNLAELSVNPSASNVAFHIRLICDDQRKSVCWALSELPFDEVEIEKLLLAYRSIHDMQIRESALFIYAGDYIRKGAVAKNAALVPMAALQTPIETFIINEKLVTSIDGDTFLEKLLRLNSVLDANSNEFQGLLSEIDAAHGLHCVAAL